MQLPKQEEKQMSKQTIIDKINELGGGVESNTSLINSINANLQETINALKWNYVEETMSDTLAKKWDWVEPNTIYDIKMLMPSGFDNKTYSIQGVWDTECYVEFPFNGDKELPGVRLESFWAALSLYEEGFRDVYCITSDGSTYRPKGDWTLKIWYRKLLTV
jgi:hypothetical protein